MKSEYGCAVELAVSVLGGKWRVEILAHIKEGAHQYGELRRRIPRMSEKMLTQRLRELCEAGLVRRRGAAYVLTARGERARPALTALNEWGSTLAAELGTAIGGAGRGRSLV
jgi:DNA-binding HxlR family transcriptional regulator